MEDLEIKRRTYKKIQTASTVKINQAYIDELNENIASRSVNPENFVPLTPEEIAQIIYKNEKQFEPNSRLIEELDFLTHEKNYNRTYQLSLFHYVRSYINDDLWEYEEVVDEDFGDAIDEVIAPGLGSVFAHLND